MLSKLTHLSPYFSIVLYTIVILFILLAAPEAPLDSCSGKFVAISIARRQSLHEGKEMFRLTGTKIFIPRFQCV